MTGRPIVGWIAVPVLLDNAYCPTWMRGLADFPGLIPTMEVGCLPVNRWFLPWC